jgi:hypothetical protein
VTDEDGGVADQSRADPLDRHPAAGTEEHLQLELFEVSQEPAGIGQVGLGHHEQGADAGIQRRDQVSVHESFPGLGVGRGDHHEHLVDVRDDDAFHLVGVVGATVQQRGARFDSDDAGEGACGAGQVADDACPISRDDRLFAQFARAHGE